MIRALLILAAVTAAAVVAYEWALTQAGQWVDRNMVGGGA